MCTWMARSLTDQLLLELGVAHDLRVVLQRGRDLLLLCRSQHTARQRQTGESKEHDANLIAPASADPNDPAAGTPR